PDAVDLSSAVEQAPGIKDHQKLREFFAALKLVAENKMSSRPWRDPFAIQDECWK
ncbi:MAG: hypothetical protein ACREOI_35920, partial [bacterium]